MACEPKFEPQLQLSCVLGLVTKIRAKESIASIGEDLLWAAGCALKASGGGGGSIFGAAKSAENVSDTELCDQIETLCNSPGAIDAGTSEETGLPKAGGLITTAILSQLLPLLLPLLSKWLKLG